MATTNAAPERTRRPPRRLAGVFADVLMWLSLAFGALRGLIAPRAGAEGERGPRGAHADFTTHRGSDREQHP